MVLEKTLESFLDSKKIKPGILIGRNDAKAGAPIARIPNMKS